MELSPFSFWPYNSYITCVNIDIALLEYFVLAPLFVCIIQSTYELLKDMWNNIWTDIKYSKLHFLQGAFWSLIVGSVVGITRFAIEYSYDKPSCDQGEDTRPAFVKDIHFLYFAVILYVLCVLIATIISLLTKPIDPKHVSD